MGLIDSKKLKRLPGRRNGSQHLHRRHHRPRVGHKQHFEARARIHHRRQTEQAASQRQSVQLSPMLPPVGKAQNGRRHTAQPHARTPPLGVWPIHRSRGVWSTPENDRRLRKVRQKAVTSTISGILLREGNHSAPFADPNPSQEVQSGYHPSALFTAETRKKELHPPRADADQHGSSWDTT